MWCDLMNGHPLYQMMASADSIPQGHVAEWYIEALRRNIIPGRGGDGDDIPMKERALGAMDNVCGQLMTFSFQVEAEDEIKCYIVWNQQMS